MNIGQVITELKKYANFSEVFQKTTFHCIRGNNVEVEVDILDAGPDVNPQSRYYCIARSENGKMATGNPAVTIEEALSIVHWNNLD